MSNFAGSVLSKDKEMTKDVVLSKLHRLIKDDKSLLIDALNKSGYSVKDNASEKQLVDKSIDALYDSKEFQKNFSYIIASEGHSNIDGSGSTTPQITVGSDAVSAIAGAVGSIFSFASAKTNKNAQKESDKNRMIAGLLQDEKKTNWLPIVIIGGVLLIGGAIAIITLRKK